MRKLFLILLGIIICVQGHGQNSCDNLYAKGVKSQQTMTVASQNRAIKLFLKAQACYDSEAKKQLCATQIATCKNTITLIKKNKQENSLSPKNSPVEEKEEQTAAKQGKNKVDTIKVALSVSESVIKFKAKGGEFKKVKVTCNYHDWKVVEHPEWIAYSVSKDNEIVLEASKNPSKEERSGMIKIECRGESVSFAVLQSKKGILNSIGL